jgi:hypothetical protein
MAAVSDDNESTGVVRWPIFLDSGAHSLYTKEVMKKVAISQRGRINPYAYYETQPFWDYVDAYANFVKSTNGALRLYANVDVIFNPKLSWKVLKYLENEHGLSPLPVIHFGTDLKWIKRHLDAGYSYLGIGGLGQEAQKKHYVHWADGVFRLICSGPDQTPSVKTHGFAIGSPSLMKRYPWWSVDSASWVKSAGFGKIFVPRKKQGEWNFFNHIAIYISEKSPSILIRGKHVSNIAAFEREMIKEWLATLGITMGDLSESSDEQTAMNHRSARILANLCFYRGLARKLPWPRSFNVKVSREGFW